MKSLKTLVQIAIVIFVVMILGACILNDASVDGAISTLTIEKNLTKRIQSTVDTSSQKSTHHPESASSVAPTILPNNEELLVNLLQSDDCSLPCYLGITPGNTSKQEAEEILDIIGATYQGEYTENGLPVFAYTHLIGDPTMINVTPDLSKGIGEQAIFHGVDITMGDDKIQRLLVYAFTTKLANKFQEYWSRYSLYEIFTSIGIPKKIAIDVNANYYTILVMYDDPEIYVTLHKNMQGDIICPDVESEKTNFFIMSSNQAVKLDIYPPGLESNFWIPIEKVLGISTEEFYNQIISDPTTCFEIKQSELSP